MAKNIFKKHLTIFVKNQKTRVVINRADDVYYITDGHTMLRVPEWLYNAEVRTVSPIFPALENGQSATRQAGAALAELDPVPSRCMVDVWERTNADQPAAVLPWLWDDVKNKRLLRAVAVADRVYSFYDGYIVAVAEYAHLEAMTATRDRFPVLKWSDDDMQIGCILLMVNSDHFKTALYDLAEVLRK